jgi:cytochrome P450
MISPRHWAQWQDARVNIAAHPLLWPAARLLRHAGPVIRVPGVGIIVSDATLGHEVLTQDELFTKQGPGSIADVMTAAFGPAALSNMDGDAHRQLRLRLGPLASPEVAESWFADARATLDQAADGILRGEQVDVAAAARRFAGHLTLTLLGAPGSEDEADAVHALGSRIASSLQLSPLKRHQVARARADSAQLVAMVRTAFQRDDLAPRSLVARLRGMGCSEEETRGLLSIFLVAGALTLGVALPRVLQLLIDARALHRLDTASAVQSAVEESMRYAAPVPATVRIASAPARVGHLTTRTGERIVILTSNLARDPSLFPDPDRFDPTRAPNPKARYLWYGAGAHFCIGFPLAQRVLQHAVARFAALPGPLRVVHRWPAHGVLLPAWHRLRVASATS